MIFYFSATGNSLYVAQRIAKATGERLISIEDCMKDSAIGFSLKPGEMLGFVSPTYFWRLPSIVEEFIAKLQLEPQPDTYVFHVATYGVTPGSSVSRMAGLLGKKGIVLHGGYGVPMVDTYTPIFDVTDADKDAQVTRNAEPYIDEAIQRIQMRVLESPRKGMWMAPASAIAQASYERARKTSSFYVLDSCVGCGLCEKDCPAGAIEVRDGKPAWTKDRCVLCLRCLHRCPKFAIQRGGKTQYHGQFMNPNVKI